MKKFIQKIIILLVFILPYAIWYTNSQNVWLAPEFDDNFKNYFDSKDVFLFEWVDSDNTFAHNMRCMFYPNFNVIIEWCWNTNYGWQLRQTIKYLWYALVVLFIVISWVRLLINWSKEDKVKPALSSILYIILGSLLFFWCVWILSVLKIWSTNWTEWLVWNIHWNPSSLLFIVLSFIKALAFIAAILMMVIHWFKMMSTADKADKVKAWLKWLLNVIVALIIIKVIDYVYYIAQLSTLVSEATTLIIEIAKVLWFIIWSLMVIMLFYAGFLFITDQWSSENMKKAKNIIIWILVTALVIFSLLLIMYEIFSEFA